MWSKVLVVDDEQMVADTLGIIFQKRGFDCRVSYTGAGAVAYSKDFCPELLLCDITLPDMNGLDVVSSVTQQCPNCRVLLLTGHYTNLGSARQWANKHKRPSRIMTKPVLPKDLLQEADTLLYASEYAADAEAS